MTPTPRPLSRNEQVRAVLLEMHAHRLAQQASPPPTDHACKGERQTRQRAV